MPISACEGWKELGIEREIKEKGMRKKGGSRVPHHTQVLREESKVNFTPNNVFCFAGKVTVRIHHDVMQLLWVVLALC